MTAYYNEFDPKAAAWLRELIRAGHIAPGDVDERSIADVRPDELRKYTQCHFFAGIGVWSYALRRAGWSDDRPVWTGSCPCQPFSSAGEGKGFADERHLWPHFHYLIEECSPRVVFGEQVASKDGLAWIDLVQADLEGSGFAVGALDTCSAGFGAPHIRQRLYWVADANADGRNESVQSLPGRLPERIGRGGLDIGVGHADDKGSQEHGRPGDVHIRQPDGSDTGRQHVDTSLPGGLADADNNEPRAGRDSGSAQGKRLWPQSSGRSAVDRLADTGREQRERGQGAAQGRQYDRQNARRIESHDGPVSVDKTCNGPQAAGPTNGYWRAVDWLHCRDGKWRPVRPGTFPLVNGSAARVGRLRGYGNAINAEAAIGFIEAYLETEAARHLQLESEMFS